MAAMAHGGDAGGDPPPPRWQPVSGCAASGSKRTRGKTKNYALNKLWESGNCKPLPISFDLTYQKTFRPVGPLAKNFKSLLGVTMRSNVPYTFDSWEKVPAEHKTAIWPEIETYFDMRPHLNGCPTVATNVVNGVSTLCAKLYSSSKNKFKERYFTNRGGHNCVGALRQQPPPDMSPESWNGLLDYYTKQENIHRAEINSANKAMQPYPSYHGSKAYVQTRYERRQLNGVYPTLIESFHQNHSRNGSFTVGGLAHQQYEKMIALQEA